MIVPTGPTVSLRCLLDSRTPARLAHAPGSNVCRTHRDRLAELLDPAQRGQVFTKPGERRTPPSIPVLYALLPLERGQSGEQQAGGSVFRSTPPGDLGAMTLRDPRSQVGGTSQDDDHNAPLSPLGTLAAIAARLDRRDLHGRPVPWPRAVGPLSAWLHLRLDALCAVDWIDDAWYDLRDLHRQISNAAGDPGSRPLGRCIIRVDDNGDQLEGGPWECGVPLYLPPQALKAMDEPVLLPEALHCSGCKWTYTRPELVKLANKSVRAAALAAKVSA